MENQLLLKNKIPLFEMIPEESKLIIDTFCSTYENDKRLNEELLNLSKTVKNYLDLLKIYDQIRDYMLSKCTKGKCQKILDFIEASTLLHRAAPIRVLKDYLIIGHPIGSGSYGEVVKAYHKLTGTPVAIKISKFNEGIVDFTKELGLWKLLNHPNIVRFYESFDHDKKKHIVMELALYKDLASLLKDREAHKLEADEIKQILRQITLGLKYLHSLSIVHRDLKPENILVFIENGSLVLKLCDFSHMRQEEDLMTSLRGTPLYNAPEITSKKTYDSKAELWSVGVILYEMVFGRDKVFQLYKKVHVEKSYSPEEIPIIPGKEELIYLLKELLQAESEYRIDWETYFDHSLFKNNDADKNNDLILQFKSDILKTEQKIDQILTKINNPEPNSNSSNLEEKLNIIEMKLENLQKENEETQIKLKELQLAPRPNPTPNPTPTPTPSPNPTPDSSTPSPNPTPVPSTPSPNLTPVPSPTPSPNLTPVPSPQTLSSTEHVEKDFSVGSIVKVTNKKLSNNTHIFMLSSSEDKNYYVATQSLLKEFRKEFENKSTFTARITSIKSEKANAFNPYTLKQGTSYFLVQIEKLP